MARDDPTLYEWDRRAGGVGPDDATPSTTGLKPTIFSRPSPGVPPRGVHEDHRRHLSTWWGEVFGGPAAYSEQLGGYERGCCTSTSVSASRTSSGSGSRP